ncbi:hypothetical protein B0T25DRAFT_633478 [Lasiosphaeria hispida]|uniref:Uncharacterized protein n=1 Tax=Lasiosphaeria hispida TaxID=260671 RepID=A0AAJ0HGS6_9PEZI|nr:hypothetical protein B0T25DRAFT_633478 [Lasiosphaeria hispida]
MRAALHRVAGPKEVHPDNLPGRTAVVIGGAFGIGYEISGALAQAGAMVNRKEEQADDAMHNIKQKSPDAYIDWKECVGNLGQVRISSSLERRGEEGHTTTSITPDVDQEEISQIFTSAFHHETNLSPHILLTENGYIGRTGQQVQEGDELCVLLSCMVPMVLRLLAGHYELVSDSYVGEKLLLPSEKGRKEQKSSNCASGTTWEDVVDKAKTQRMAIQ